MKIAIIGSGISGNSAAWALAKEHEVVLYEKRDRPGGHSATVDVNYDGKTIPVDTGFIVYNERNYPDLTALFQHLDVKTLSTFMTFSVSMDDGRLEWRGNHLRGIFAQRLNLFRPSFLSMLSDIVRFNRRALKDLDSGALCGLTLDDYLQKRKFSKRLKDDYLVPMTSAIWSTPSRKMLEFPAESLIRFMNNHRLIQYTRPLWRTVDGGSRNYVSKLLADTDAEIRLSTPVANVRRYADGVEVTDHNGNKELFDHVIMASHSDHALGMLSEPNKAEQEILSAIQYRPNDVWLHRDPALMPKKRDAWASWNYLGNRGEDLAENGPMSEVSVTYWMNSLQNIDEKYPLFVTLNPLQEPDPALTFGRFNYSHPQFDMAAVEAQKRLPEIQGADRIWYCGAWTGFGFHEDGLRSGLDVAEALGASIPWRKPRVAQNVSSLPPLTPQPTGAPTLEAAE